MYLSYSMDKFTVKEAMGAYLKPQFKQTFVLLKYKTIAKSDNFVKIKP